MDENESNSPRVVLIEDDNAIREAVSEILEIEGYTVVGYPDGAQALIGLAINPRPKLIFLDLMMPVMDGWKFLEIRKGLTSALRAIPVFVISAVANQMRGRTEIAGCLNKPVDLNILLSIVREYCGAPQIQKA